MKPEKKEPRVSMAAGEAAELIGAYDDWAGSLRPEERQEYLARFDRIRNRVCALLEGKAKQ